MSASHDKHHDYHLVQPSWWPFVGAMSAFVLAIGAVQWMKGGASYTMIIGFALVLYTMFMWWRDVISEAHAGDHTPVVSLHLRYGMIMFIMSEVMFFVAWFWAFFDASLFAGEAGQVARVAATGGIWPPADTKVLDALHWPLLNTLLLLTSGTTITWAHHALLANDRKGVVWGLILTIILGVIFTGVQAYEYATAPFNFIGGNIYSSTFYLATGFHGFHVLIGTIFLIICLLRTLKGHFKPEQHFGFEAAAWYWHFVDVVWLFLFVCIYLWGNAGGTLGH